ncbi:hypothetical protein [Streptomyces gardneri]|uniref:hypothetical protein n=1 Tax=Streptomyces gardneri TaxID=66892 RepID=UPI0033DD54B8
MPAAHLAILRDEPSACHKTVTRIHRLHAIRKADLMRRLTTAALAAGTTILLALTGCGASENPPATPAAKTGAEGATDSASTPATETTSPSPTASPEPTTAAPLKLGATHTWEDVDAGVSGISTALSYQQGIKSVGLAAEETGNAGYIWAALELKVCSTKGMFIATPTPWTLSYADGARIEPSSSTWDDFPKPEFPFETKLTPGKCVRGKVVFPVPGNSNPETIVYAPESAETPVEWAVPAK